MPYANCYENAEAIELHPTTWLLGIRLAMLLPLTILSCVASLGFRDRCSVTDLGLTGVIFHDGLETKFIRELTTNRVHFQRAHLHGRTTNDARFYAYLQYLRAHPEVTRVLLTDASGANQISH